MPGNYQPPTPQPPQQPSRLDQIDVSKIHLMREEELPQFDEILNDPNGPNYISKLLHQTRLHQNVIHINEFHQYEPLFRYSGREELGDQEYGRLSLEYARRICRFDPVYIVNDNNEILFVLPPVFNRTNTMNSLGPAGVNIAQAFVNACMLPDEVANEKRSKYGKYYNELFRLAQNEKEYEHHKKVAAEIAEDALKRAGAQRQQAQEQAEIEDIDPSTLKDKSGYTSSTSGKSEALPYSGDDDVDYM